MPKVIDEVADRIRKVREGKSLTQKEFADKLGVAQSYISRVEAKKRGAGMDLILSLRGSFPDVSLEWLLTGKESAPPELIISSSEKDAHLRDEVFRPVPLVADSIAAGSGSVVSDDVTDYAVIHGPTLGRRKNLVAVKVRGDSMTPELPEGSMVVIDRDDRKIREGSIYAVRVNNDEVTIKYVEMDKGDLVLIPANRQHRERRIRVGKGEESPVIGRVIWSWRSWA